jgi:TRAP-type C4-dicarboxylate transport system substrate-binding protein
MRMAFGMAGAVALLAATSGGVIAQQHTMRIGMVTVNDAQHSFAQRYAEELGKRTKGAIKVEVFPAAQLGGIPRQIENIKLGAQAAFVSPTGFFSGINRGFEALDAPGIYKSVWHAQNAITDPAFREKYVSLGESQGVLLGSVWVYGPTAIASLKPLRTLDDMKGVKVRVLATKMESKMASVLGMAGVPMPYNEVLAALQQRTIDACRSAMSVMGASKFFTSTKSITATEDGMIVSGLWISRTWMNKLPKDLQQVVLATGKDLESWAVENADGYESRAAKLWTDNGAEVIRLSAKDQAEMTKRLAPLGDEFLGSEAATKPMYDLLKQTLARVSDKKPAK